MGKKNKSKSQKPKAINTISFFLTSAVVAALVTGIFSLIISINTNKRLSEIETQKFEYELHQIRYDKLQEFLVFFSEFDVYDDEIIYKFDIDSDQYTTDMALTIMNDSIDTFCAKLLQLNAYLSDQGLELLEKEINIDSTLEKNLPNIDDLTSAEDINLAIKEHMVFVNKEFTDFSSIIIKVITYDIFREYLPGSTRN